MSNGVLQSGQVTPGHLVVWVTDGVVADAGVTFLNTYGEFVATLKGIDFTIPNNDWEIPIDLPPGYTRYRIHSLVLSGATANLSAATVGVFTQASGGGAVVVTGGTGVTVNNGTDDTVNNMQMFTIQNQNTLALNDLILFFRVTSPANGLGNVSVFYQPLP